MSIEIDDLHKRFNGAAALDGVSLTAAPGELLALLGPSGSGKTTLLRIIAGLERPDRGTIAFDGRNALDVPSRARGIGFVFQHYALFRHMRVEDNIAFGLSVRPRVKRPSKTAISARVTELLALVQLEGLGRRFPHELSGGQQQRVALARALAVEPRLLLLDEPFGALDAKVRVELRHWLRGLHHQLGLTTIFVTHDQDEAFDLADRVAILNAGRIEQIGPPSEVYDRPNSRFVLDFLGAVNRLPCRVVAGRARLTAQGPSFDAGGLADGAAVAYVRPHDIEFAPASIIASGEATVRSASLAGPRARLLLDYHGQSLEAESDRATADRLDLSPGQLVRIRFKTVRFFAVETAGRARAANGVADDTAARLMPIHLAQFQPLSLSG